MTDRAAGRPAGGSRRSRRALGSAWAAGALFLTGVGLLAVRVAAGQDPALRARAAATPLPARRILVRRIYERRVIVHLPPSAPSRPTESSERVGSAGLPATPPAVTRTS
jgi:hypothetical protein